MTERPILFQGPMVRAYRREVDPKTQTRRTRGLDHVNFEPDLWEVTELRPGEFLFGERGTCTAGVIRCPSGVPGDRLWTREAWQTWERFDKLPPRELAPLGAGVHYSADGDPAEWSEIAWGRTRPGMFLPRWASRDTLEVVSARPERLQHITAADAVAEGCESCTPYDQFRALWESINGNKLPWSKNPWVWRIEFRRITT